MYMFAGQSCTIVQHGAVRSKIRRFNREEYYTMWVHNSEIEGLTPTPAPEPPPKLEYRCLRCGDDGYAADAVQCVACSDQGITSELFEVMKK